MWFDQQQHTQKQTNFKNVASINNPSHSWLPFLLRSSFMGKKTTKNFLFQFLITININAIFLQTCIYCKHVHMWLTMSNVIENDSMRQPKRRVRGEESVRNTLIKFLGSFCKYNVYLHLLLIYSISHWGKFSSKCSFVVSVCL